MDGIYVVVCENKVLVEDYIRRKQLNIQVVSTEKDGTLGQSIYDGLIAISKEHPKGGEILINFGDTLLTDIAPNDLQRDTVCFAQSSITSGSKFFEDTNGKITFLTDKVPIEAAEKGKSLQAIAGAFSFSNLYDLCDCLKNVQNDKDQRIDDFYKALMHYSEKHPFQLKKTKNWQDTGHTESCYQDKTGVEARTFNSIEINEHKGTLTKRSQYIDKFLDEINWYIKMPNELQYLLPRIYDYSLDRSNPYVEMECYGYHTLHELLMDENVPLVRWQHLLEQLLFIVNDMERFTVEASKDELDSAMESIYVQKTLARLTDLKEQAEFKPFFEENIEINGVQYPSLNEVMKILPELVREKVIQKFQGEFTVIHGDLCFANILVEDKYNYMRVIDPRGRFGKFDIYGDPRYELAKLLHTLEGNYDYIIEDMFAIERNGTALTYSVPDRSRYVCELFGEVFSEKLKDVTAVRLIEATLFLSMIPLHCDHLERQYAMLATGLMLLKRIMEDGN